MNALSDRKIQLFLFGILLAVYLLVYIPIPDSIDGSDTLDVARTLVMDGSPASTILSTPRQLIVTGNEGEQYLISPDGERYTKKGVTPSLLLIPFVIVAQALPWLSVRATAMLFNPLILAMSGAAVYGLLRECGRSQRVSIITALIYGLATLAAVYARTLFGEPLAGLLLTIALTYAHRYRNFGDSRPAFIAGFALALSIGVNLTYAALIPIVGMYAFSGFIPFTELRTHFSASLQSHVPKKRLFQGVIAFALPVVAAVGLLALYNLARFGSLTESGYYLGSVEGFTTPILNGLYGLWLSPYKGFFWYSPAMLLAIPGLFMLFRREKALVIVILALVAAQSVIYGTWWAWDGAWCWGARFLLPVLPLMMLLVAPVIERVLQRRSLLIPAILLVLVSVGVQLLGALYDYRYFFERIYVYDLTVPTNNPILTHLAMLLTGWQSDLALLAEGFDPIHLLAAVGLAMISAIVLMIPRKLPRFIAYGLFTLAVIIALNVVVWRQQDNASQQYVTHLTEALQPPGTALVASFQPGTALMDVKSIARFFVLNPHAPEDNPPVQKQLQRAMARGDIVWYMTWFPPASPDNWLEKSLWQKYALISQTLPDDTHRLMGFNTRPAPEADLPGGWQFDALNLDNYGIRRDDDGIFLTLDWSIAAPDPTNYTWFVHLVNANNEIIHQQDRAPQGGYAPVSGWTPGEPVTDRLFFPLDKNVDVTGWHVRVGVINPADGQPVAVTDSQHNTLPDPFILIPADNS